MFQNTVCKVRLLVVRCKARLSQPRVRLPGRSEAQRF